MSEVVEGEGFEGGEVGLVGAGGGVVSGLIGGMGGW